MWTPITALSYLLETTADCVSFISCDLSGVDVSCFGMKPVKIINIKSIVVRLQHSQSQSDVSNVRAASLSRAPRTGVHTTAKPDPPRHFRHVAIKSKVNRGGVHQALHWLPWLLTD